jgi:DeoR-like helix-turn-helix domain
MLLSVLAAPQQSFWVVPTTPPAVPHELREQLAELADFVTRCRSGVIRDGYRRELDYAPAPEMPARLAKQLFELLRGVALVMGHQEATTTDLDRIKRVALDCIPAVRRTILRAVARMATVDETLTTTKVAQGVQYSTATVRRALEDLQALGVLSVTKGGQGVPDRWAVRDEWHTALDTFKEVESALQTRREETFTETSEGTPHTHTANAEKSSIEHQPRHCERNGRALWCKARLYRGGEASTLVFASGY